MKICLYARADRLYYYVPLAKHFKTSASSEFFFVTESLEEEKYVKNYYPDTNVYCLYRWLETNHCNVSNSDLEDLQNRYKHISIWRMLYSDRFFINYAYNDVIEMIYKHFSFFEYVFNKEMPDFVLDEAVATFGSYVACEVAGKRNCHYVGAIIDRTHPYNNFFTFDNAMQLSASMEKRYLDYDFTDEGVKAAREYYHEFCQKDIKPAYMEKDKVPRFTWKCLLAPLSYLNRLLKCCQGKYNNKNFFIEYKRPWHDRVYMDFERWVRFQISKKYYKEPDFRDKYYLFTLHFQPEATTLVCAEKYEKQIIAIDHIAKSLPLGTMLYVKEHYACLGHRHVNFYKQLAGYPNVRLITPFANIHDLIKESQAVIVLTSTTGFEALLHRKKVFVLGDVYYQFSKNVTKMNDVYNEWYKLWNTECDQTEEEVIRLLSAYYSELKTGNILYESANYDSEDNIRNIYLSYLDVLHSYEG